MKMIFLVLACSIVIVSCEKDESVDLLTQGTWKLDNEFIQGSEELIEFQPDNKYKASSSLNTTLSWTILGDWIRQGNDIILSNSVIDLPDDASFALFYEYISSGADQSGSSSDDLYHNILKFSFTLGEQKKWTILKLTGDSLIVGSGNETLRYYRANGIDSKY